MAAAFDEMNGFGGEVRAPYKAFAEWLGVQHLDTLRQKSAEAEVLFRRSGITFAVYGAEEAAERLIPFDILPRIIAADEWRRLELGIEQRVRALNAFLYDIYHRQEILKAGKIPEELVIQNSAFLPEMIGVDPPRGVYSHIIGVDLVRIGEDDFRVLEDNTRTPSGVSYMLENRETMMHLFPDLFSRNRVRPVENYTDALLKTLESVAPANLDSEPTIALLTPGVYNSAYFEHSFLADQMGVELVESSDLVVIDGLLRMKTTQGLKRVDVLYRRVDDDFLDPLVFDPTSLLGVPGIFDVYRSGRVTIVNAPGAGIADDKAIYSYIPAIIEFYTGKPPILATLKPIAAVIPVVSNTCSSISPISLSRKCTVWWLRHARRPKVDQGSNRSIPGKARCEPEKLYRPADTLAFDMSDARRHERCAPASRLASLRAYGDQVRLMRED